MLVFDRLETPHKGRGFALLEALLSILILSVVTTATLRSLSFTSKTLSDTALHSRISCSQFECPVKTILAQKVTCRCRKGDTSDSAIILP